MVLPLMKQKKCEKLDDLNKYITNSFRRKYVVFHSKVDLESGSYFLITLQCVSYGGGEDYQRIEMMFPLISTALNKDIAYKNIYR